MQFIRIHRRISAVVAIAIAATALFASAASARPLEGPVHQTEQTWPHDPPILATAPHSAYGATEAQSALAHSYKVPPTARFSTAGIVSSSKPAVAAAVSAPKISTSSDSFHWGDAAIGAATVMAIVLLVGGGALITRRRMQVGQA